MQNLLHYISQRAYITPDLRKAILDAFQIVETKKGDEILQEGERAKYLYFVDKGMLHNYYLHDTKQVSSWFYSEHQFITAWSSFYLQKPSFETIECLEDCILYRISFSDFQKLIADYPAFGNFARLLAEDILAILDEFTKSWSFLSAKEKYELWLDLRKRKSILSKSENGSKLTGFPTTFKICLQIFVT